MRSIHLVTSLSVDKTKQETQPLHLARLASATAFHVYLNQYELEPLRVALAAGVRYLTIWNIQHGNPISQDHAVLVRGGLQKLTGACYSAPIATRE